MDADNARFKPSFEKFIDANEALLDCYDRIDKAELDGKSPAQLSGRCISEKAAIKNILESNSLTMTNLVKDRVGILYAFNEIGGKRNVVIEEE